MSKRKRYAAEEIISKLREAEVHLAQGETVGQVVRRLGVSEQTYYRWRREFGGMRVDQAKRLKRARARERAAQAAGGRAGARQLDPARGGLGKLLSPAKRRRAVAHARAELRISERRSCRVVGQARATQRYVPRESPDEQALIARMVALATRFGRYGYRRVTALLRQEGWRVNHKRVERLWRQEGLKVPQGQPGLDPIRRTSKMRGNSPERMSRWRRRAGDASCATWGRRRNRAWLELTAAAYNLVRISRLEPVPL